MKSAAYLMAGVVAAALTIPAASSFGYVVTLNSGMLINQLPGDAFGVATGTATTTAAFMGMNSRVSLEGIGSAANDYAKATYTYSQGGFFASDARLARSNDTSSKITGDVQFTVDSNIYYSAASAFSATTIGAPSSVHYSYYLIDQTTSTVLYSANYSALSTGTETINDTTPGWATYGLENGQLTAGHIYEWAYALTFTDSSTVTTGSGTMQGDIQLIFSETGVPEPASVGVLALTAGGLLFRRRK